MICRDCPLPSVRCPQSVAPVTSTRGNTKKKRPNRSLNTFTAFSGTNLGCTVFRRLQDSVISGLQQLQQLIGGILKLAHKYHGCNNIGLVAGFFVQRYPIAVKDAGLYFPSLTAYTGDISRQAVHVEGITFAGLLH